MSDAFRAMSDDEVRQISLIIESLNRSTFDFLQLEVGDVKLTLGKGVPPSVAIAAPSGAAPGVAANPWIAPPQPAAPAPAAAVAAPAAAPASPAPAAKDQAAKDTVAITAPLLGRFYAQPEPGASPYVSIGSQVTADTTVALIEVMKTFNAVPAGVSGIITEICVPDAIFVEYGQVLFRVRPTKTT
jgi:acetyl-CoA carboxylase biotin carboxyl carrier protein